jgi:large exoprotein involved in heme utilization and adhesion
VRLAIRNNNVDVNIPSDVHRGDIFLTNRAMINTNSERGGAIQIYGRNVLLRNRSEIDSTTNGTGSGGTVAIDASGAIKFIDSRLFTTANTRGRAGDVLLTTRRLLIRDGAQIGTAGNGEGGQSGQLTVNASEWVEVSKSGSLFSTVTSNEQANDLTLTTRRLLVRDQARITTSATQLQFSPIALGNGGRLTIQASDSVEVREDGIITTTTTGPGNAGNLSIIANLVEIRGGGTITTSTLSSGNAGNLNIVTNRLILRREGLIDARSENGNGLERATNATGEAGNIIIHARDLLQADNSVISSRSENSSGGRIAIAAGRIRLNNSDIKTDVFSGRGNGGSIILNADSIFAFGDSNILASSTNGGGGNITLNTPSFFGSNYVPTPPGSNLEELDGNGRVDINATGATRSGTITLPEINPVQGAIKPPTEVQDSSRLLATACPADLGSSFVVTGRGGIPEDPRQPLVSTVLWRDQRGEPELPNPPAADPQPTPREPLLPTVPDAPMIAEAQGWVQQPDGAIALISSGDGIRPIAPPPTACPL